MAQRNRVGHSCGIQEQEGVRGAAAGWEQSPSMGESRGLCAWMSLSCAASQELGLGTELSKVKDLLEQVQQGPHWCWVSDEQRLWELGLISLERRRLRGFYQSIKISI